MRSPHDEEVVGMVRRTGVPGLALIPSVTLALAPAPVGPSPAAAPQYRIAYTIGMPDVTSHLYAVTLSVSGLIGRPLDLQLPVWSPGRYARMDFAKNVQGFSATARDGTPLRWDKGNGSRWRVFPGANRSVRVAYRVFANAPMSGTFSVLDSAHANWNGAALFMYVDGHKQDPVSLAIEAPESWTIMNGDVTRPGQRLFQFPNYDLLIDTPTEVAPAGHLVLDSFVVDDRVYRVMVHHTGGVPAGTRERFVRDLERIVRYENSIFGAPPLERYTFLFNIGYPGGDGMEHLYSTQIQAPHAWTDTTKVLPGIRSAAHEYFHVWNVKRVRPAALGPFDYTREQYQPSLWVAEGWTQYYGQVTLHRVGIEDTDAFYASMAALVRENLTAPGRKEVSARMASFHAPFWDGAPQVQPTNEAHTFFTYYSKGAGIAAYLDLLIRHRSNNAKSLNDAFNNLKQRAWHAPRVSYYLQGRGYTEDDVEGAVTDAAGTNLHEWFAQHVGGTEDMDYDEALGWAGLKLVRTASGPWRIEEIPDAMPEELRVRLGWVTGRVDK
jgi:predicted metalloprotease with PDZ domain